MTVKEILDKSIKKLALSDIDEAKVDAMLLMEYVFGINKTKYFMSMNDEADAEKSKVYEALIEKRCRHIPLQYLIGTQDFMGFEFKVNENVLIPRYDTEVVADEAMKAIKSVDNPKILDVCTGSGCIAIALSKLIRDSKVKAIDISKEALNVAQENNSNLGASVEFTESDLFEKLSENEKYDLIISNPPYIKTQVIKGLMSEVKNFEPMLALDGDEDGLKFYRRISNEAPKYMKNGGVLVYEIGHDQAEEVSELLKENGFKDIVVKKDLAGLDRAVIAKYVY